MQYLTGAKYLLWLLQPSDENPWALLSVTQDPEPREYIIAIIAKIKKVIAGDTLIKKDWYYPEIPYITANHDASLAGWRACMYMAWGGDDKWKQGAVEYLHSASSYCRKAAHYHIYSCNDKLYDPDLPPWESNANHPDPSLIRLKEYTKLQEDKLQELLKEEECTNLNSVKDATPT